MPLVSTSKLLVAVLAAGWLAEALAGKNSDVEAGIAAYNSGDHEAALAAYTAAEAELGERPEIFYNRGLALIAKGDKDEARKAFERGTESTHPDVHASSEYELGNLDLDAEAFDPAIEHYIKCLKAKPDHANAKWNLELALLKKKQKEEEEKKKQEEEKKDQEKQDQENKDEEKKDEQKQDEEKKDEEKKDEEKKDEQKQDEEKKDEQKQDEQKQDEQKPDEQKQDEQKQDEQKQEKDEQPQPQPQAQPQLDKADLDKALEQLDAEDNFQLDRPARQVRVEKDW
ncbi:tetratricopeptide repeat protein [Nannocystis punicea]|uniref:Tetratricopeptide repeat protein n=1 Tax=Nannocystis punicea TaxID=2995304 RepID=A0ABY7HAN1_9BACT|nr:tetratricopeptide repeat protein [Nannocystis poenicansa]WAS96271.1 tetratricopeptide repeat protein [Nannocystis poenicansa]